MSRPCTPDRAKQPDPLVTRKAATSIRLPGIKTSLSKAWSIPNIKTRLKKTLKLNYEPDDWQAHVIRRLVQGYDVILLAGTGYGKSLVFEGLATLTGKSKVLIIISPLKALERDQAAQANEKGIKAVVLNEDTTKTAGIWETARTTAKMIYLSPEMALSPRFGTIWRDGRFRSRLAAVVVDEAHCVEEWGGADFRPDYQQLDRLRNYTGQDVPFLACTATCPTPTFNTLWSTLGFGTRPFWGLDVGVDRPNLFYHVRELTNEKNPALDIVPILPAEITSTTPPSAIPKTLIYCKTEDQCRVTSEFIRRCFPEELRGVVQAFSSTISEKGKKQAWDDFLSGRLRIMPATDAAGMGCNVTDVQYVFCVGVPQSVSQVFQRFGRAGRDRVTDAVCVLLVPKWTVRPQQEVVLNPALARVKGKTGGDTAAKVIRRSKLPNGLEHLINLKHDRPRGCVHKYFIKHFRPETRIDKYTGLGDDARLVSRGDRSRDSPFELTWTVHDLGRSPPVSRCCFLDTPNAIAHLAPATMDDTRLSRYAADFKYPIVRPSSRSGSSASQNSDTSRTASVVTAQDSDDGMSSGDEPIPLAITQSHKDTLQTNLLKWRIAQLPEDEHILPSALYLPPKQLAKIIAAATTISETPANKMDAKWLRQLVKLDILSNDQVASLALVLQNWKNKLVNALPPVQRTPHSQRRPSKRPRSDFTPAPRSPSPTPIGSTQSPPGVELTPRPRAEVLNLPVSSPTPRAQNVTHQPPQNMSPSHYREHLSPAPSAPPRTTTTSYYRQRTHAYPTATPTPLPNPSRPAVGPSRIPQPRFGPSPLTAATPTPLPNPSRPAMGPSRIPQPRFGQSPSTASAQPQQWHHLGPGPSSSPTHTVVQNPYLSSPMSSGGSSGLPAWYSALRPAATPPPAHPALPHVPRTKSRLGES